jgi:hypothetical protein
MTPGRLLWLTRHFFRHGLRGAYGRVIVAPRVLRCAPLTGLTDRRCEVHVLTSREDWLPLLWALRTFYRTTRRSYRLCIHDDGSLPAPAIAELRRQFPDARVVLRPDADRRMQDALAGAPQCRDFRARNPLLLKTVDFAVYLEAERLVLLDSDLLFFRSPAALLERAEAGADFRNSFNRDWNYGYSVRWEELVRRAPPPVETMINSGLGVLRRGAVSMERCEDYFVRFPELPSHWHRIEQTLVALCAARDGYAMLPKEYDVHDGPTDFALPVRHYSGAFRRRLYTEGMPYVWRHRAALLE